MNERDMRMMYDGRRLPPRNSRGEFRRRRRGDRGMDYTDMRGDMNYDMARGGSRGGSRSGRGRGDRGDYADYDMARGGDMRPMDYRGGDYRNGQMSDMHHGGMRGGGYEPVEFMGYCSGYYGAPQSDYGDMRAYNMSGMRDYGYGDMRGRRDYGYDYGYGYGDYGETLSEKELDEWCHKLKSQLDEREKQMFSKEIISQKAKQMGKQMENFGEKELEVATLMVYTDYKNSIGQNPDLAIKLAFDWLTDKDVKVKGAEKLAVYYDEIVMGGEDD